jgi:alkaline phosphatase D
MNKFIVIILGVFLFFSCGEKGRNQQETIKEDSFTIGLGSCYNTRLNDNTIWKEIVKNEPDSWIWLGDIVYADTEDMSKMKQAYDELKFDEEYQKLIKKSEVIGIWDDHDYGINDGGKEFPKKKQSKLQLLDFLDVDSSNSVFSHEGVYNSYVYGEENRKVKVILLDTRYFRDSLIRNSNEGNRYKVNETGDILGEEQWIWLESELSKNEASIHIIASGYQVVAWEPFFEKWSNFPVARRRLFDLLKQTNPNKAFLLSGDRHISEGAKIDLEGLKYPLYEFTCSGLTHTWSENWPEENRYRVTDLVVEKNFGLINIDWDGDVPSITFEIRGKDNQLFTSYSPKF